MEFREYKESDADIILSWIKSERDLRFWSADRYGNYPIKSEDINNNYKECSSFGNFFPFTLEDNGKIIGHLILRYPGEDRSVVRLGFIIVDRDIRGMGYGRRLIEEAIKYAKKELGVKEINLGVFSNNDNAYNCYKAVGFKVVGIEKDAYTFKDEKWDCIEMILED